MSLLLLRCIQIIAYNCQDTGQYNNLVLFDAASPSASSGPLPGTWMRVCDGAVSSVAFR